MKMEKSTGIYSLRRFFKNISRAIALLLFTVLLLIPVEKIFCGDDFVPEELAQEIASVEHLERWGEGVCGPPVVLRDLDGSVSGYLIPYKIDAGVFPSREEIQSGMDDAKELLEQAEADFAVLRENLLAETEIEVKHENGVATYLFPPEWIAAQENIRELRNSAWGIGEYSTLIISATKTLAPVLMGSNGISPYHIWPAIAEGKAQEELATEHVVLTATFFSPPMDIMYEFEGAGRTIWVMLNPPRIFLPGEIVNKEIPAPEEEGVPAGEIEAELEAERQWVADRWEEILKKVQK